MLIELSNAIYMKFIKFINNILLFINYVFIKFVPLVVSVFRMLVIFFIYFFFRCCSPLF